MYKTTLVNLGADAGSASADFGRQCLGELPVEAVLRLLERFRDLDHIQNFEADPEILLESRRRKRVVRVDHGKLCLYDPSNILASAFVLTPEGIVAELELAAKAGVGRASAGSRDDSGELLVKRLLGPRAALPLRPAHRIVLAVVTLVLAVYCLYAQPASNTPPVPVGFVPLTESKALAAALTDLTGVYLTGNRPGDHGLALDGDGGLKLFELNDQAAPSLIRDTYRLGRVNGTLCVLSTQPGGAIFASGKDTLSFCGETYQRVP